MSTQRDLFEARYQHIAATDRVGWSDEDTIANSVEKIRQIILGMQPGAFLELGCGRGNIAIAFADEWQVTGVDFSPTAVRWANQLALKTSKSATFVEADLSEDWPFGGSSFDIVFDANCLHFFHGVDRQHFIREAYRVAKPGGILILDTIVNLPAQEHWKMLGYDPLTKASDRDGVAMNYYTEVPELLQLVAGNGFTITSTEITKLDDEHVWLVATKA